MAEITEIPVEELNADRAEAFADASWCGLALAHDIRTYNGGDVAERLQGNLRVIDAIDAEITRRQAVDDGS